MSFIKQLNDVKKTVRKILENHKETRDDDNLLTLKVWAEQNPELREKFYTFRAFSEDFLKGEYAKTESIRRARQQLQQKHEDLRGDLYNQRQKIGEQTTIEINKS